MQVRFDPFQGAGEVCAARAQNKNDARFWSRIDIDRKFCGGMFMVRKHLTSLVTLIVFLILAFATDTSSAQITHRPTFPQTKPTPEGSGTGHSKQHKRALSSAQAGPTAPQGLNIRAVSQGGLFSGRHLSGVVVDQSSTTGDAYVALDNEPASWGQTSFDLVHVDST